MRTQLLAALKEADDYISGQELCEHFGVSRTAIWKAVKQLKEAGYVIEAVQNKGYKIVSTPDCLNTAELESIRKTKWAGREIFYFDTIDSTNTKAKQLAEEGHPTGTLVVAEKQEAGRGRRGRGFESPAGVGIFMTLVLKPDFAPDRASMLTLIAALAVSKAISEKTGQEAGIKWPNDIVMNGKKVCGILTEMSAQLDYINHVVIGIGINVQNESFPKEIEQVATSILMETGQHVNRAELIEAVLEQFERYYGIFLETEDLSGLVKEYDAHLINMHKQVRVLDPKEPYEAKAMGITVRRVQQMCKQGEISGAVKKGHSWLIPENAVWPDSVEKKKPMPIGISDFKTATTSYYYVDKTLLIRDFLDTKPMVSLFTRPRRFGKTLNMDMLRVFFEISDKNTSKYFADKNIWQCGEEYRSHQGKYPVIFLTFKDVKFDTWDATIDKIRGLLQEEYGRHQELLNSDKLSQYEKEYFTKIISATANEVELTSSLERLSKMLASHYDKAPVIIIDEYDTPIQEGYSKDFYDEIIGFMRNFFSGAFKDNKNLSYGFLTGILRIAQESIFSGLNNLTVNSVMDEEYDSFFGFSSFSNYHSTAFFLSITVDGVYALNFCSLEHLLNSLFDLSLVCFRMYKECIFLLTHVCHGFLCDNRTDDYVIVLNTCHYAYTSSIDATASFVTTTVLCFITSYVLIVAGVAVSTSAMFLAERITF